MKVEALQFGRINIDGQIFTNDVIIDRGNVYLRDKQNSRAFKTQYGHTPLTAGENIPWHCERLVIGNGMYERLPIRDDFREEAQKRGVEIIVKSTTEAIQELNRENTNLILHITC